MRARLNWNRGLFRLWVVATACWTGFWIWAVWDDVSRGRDYPSVDEFLLALVGIPLAVLALGFLIRWVIRGWRDPSE